MSEHTPSRPPLLRHHPVIGGLQLTCAILWMICILTTFKAISANQPLYELANSLCFGNLMFVGMFIRLRDNTPPTLFWRLIQAAHTLGLAVTILLFCAIIYRGLFGV